MLPTLTNFLLLLSLIPAVPVTLIVLIMTKKCGVSGLGSAAEMVCSHMPGLTEKQRDMCRAAPDAMVAVGQGYRLGIAECQHHFANHRWNCTPIGTKSSFAHVVVVGSREAAYTYGISSAGVAYSVAAACSRGNITSCGCQAVRKPAPPASSWKWAGCSVDIGFGLGFARRFLDARELEADPRSLMNLHNNRAGRTAVKSKMVQECKCHGVSGSCTMRTCWRALPPFRLVADHLMRKYWRARAVVPTPTGLHTRKGRLRPRRSDLVYLQPSPNYCERDLAAGSLGTAGRLCNRSSSGMGGCDVLCCGRGYNTHQSVKSWQCNCKFHWCCYVQCQTCSQRTQLYTCN